MNTSPRSIGKQTLEPRAAAGCGVSSAIPNQSPAGEAARPAEYGGCMPRLLIVEDNFWLALALTEEVEELGWRPVGPARNLSDALILARNSKLDAALLDFDLG